MTTATERLLKFDPNMQLLPSKPDGGKYNSFLMKDHPEIEFPVGIEAEVGEFIYGFIRWFKPARILETGTRVGISTRYMALALSDNMGGILTTLERDPYTAAIAQTKILDACLGAHVDIVTGDSRDYKPADTIDLMWLDSEPEYRYGELTRWWPDLKPGGMVFIHDLPRIDCAPFGKTPDTFIAGLRSGEARAMTFDCGWGLTVIQKAHGQDVQREIFNGEG